MQEVLPITSEDIRKTCHLCCWSSLFQKTSSPSSRSANHANWFMLGVIQTIFVPAKHNYVSTSLAWLRFLTQRTIHHFQVLSTLSHALLPSRAQNYHQHTLIIHHQFNRLRSHPLFCSTIKPLLLKSLLMLIPRLTLNQQFLMRENTALNFQYPQHHLPLHPLHPRFLFNSPPHLFLFSLPSILYLLSRSL